MANSPLPDAEVTKVPTPTPPKPEADAWTKLAKSKDYAEIHAYLEQRKEAYRRFLPNGTPVENAKDDDIASHYKMAACVIKEIEAFQGAIALRTMK